MRNGDRGYLFYGRGPPPPSEQPAAPADCPTPDDPEQPCLERRLASKLPEMRPRPNERILCGLFGFVSISKSCHSRAVDRNLMSDNELVKCGRVALPGQ